MKNIFNRLTLLGVLFATIFGACRKDESNKVTYDNKGVTAEIMASATAVVLTESTANEQVINFTWEKPDFGFSAAVAYSLQFDTSAAFGAPQTTPVGNDLYTMGFNGGDLNQMATKFGLKPDSIGTLMVRLVAEVKQNAGGGAGSSTVIPIVYSDPVAVKVTPYSSEVVYPTIYAVGAFQGWNPAEGIKLYSLNSNDKYEGYINVPGTSGGDLEFKFTSQPDWGGTNYGSGGDAVTDGFITTGPLSTDGGAGNLKVPGMGYYRLKVDLVGLTFEAYQISWGLIGSATPTGWDSDTDLIYDAATQTLVIESITLVPGEIKFRANNDWAINYGLDAAGTTLVQDGSNIVVSEGGTYKVVLDLTNSTHYTYSLTKL